MADQATDQSILYKAIPTSIGLTKIQLAMTTGVDLVLSTIGYGDGGGSPIVPDPDQTALVNQIGSTDIIGTEIDTEDNVTWYSGIIEAGAATGTLREIGLFDDEGNLCFVGNVPDIILPEPAEGVAINIPIQLGVKNYYSRYISIKTHIKVIEQIEGSGGYSLFDLVQKDHILSYEESEGFALQGTYVYKEGIGGMYYGYPDFIKTCIDEKNSPDTVIRRIPLGANTITGYVHPNGHIYYEISDKPKVDAYFEQYGVAWFWGVDEENETVFLPRNNYFFKNSSVDPGIFNPATLPSLAHNHTLTLESAGDHSHTITISSAGSHSHSLTIYSAGSHSHTKGTMRIRGTGPFWYSGNASGAQSQVTGAFFIDTSSKFYGVKDNYVGSNDPRIGFDTDKNTNNITSWIGSTSLAGDHSHNFSMGTSGSHVHPVSISQNGSHVHEGVADSKEIVPNNMIGDTVTPPSVNLLLYIVVGNVRRKFAMVVDQIVEEAIERIEEAASEGIQEVEEEVETGKTEINNTLEEAKTEINTVAQEVEEQIAADVDAAKDYSEASEYWAGISEYWAGISTQGQQQADWDQTDPTKVDYIKNKPQVDWANLVYLNSQQTLTNKTINASQNSISNLGFSSIAQGVILTSLGEGVVSDTTLATSKAIWDSIKDIIIRFTNLDSSMVLTVLDSSLVSNTTLATSQAVLNAINSLPTASMSVLTDMTDTSSLSNNSLPTSLAVYTAIIRAISDSSNLIPGEGIIINTSNHTEVSVTTSRPGLQVKSIYTGTKPEIGTLNYLFTYKDVSYRLQTETSIVSSNPNLIVTSYYEGTKSSVGIETYTFTYVSNEYGTYWSENGEEVELSDYEISIVGTPQNNDTITLTYTTTSIETPAHWENTSGEAISLADYYLVITSGEARVNDTINLIYTTISSSVISVDTDNIANILDFKKIKGNPNYIFQEGIKSQAKLRTTTLISTNDPDLSIISTYTGTQSSVGVIENSISYVDNSGTLEWIDDSTGEAIDPTDYYIQITGVPQEDDNIVITYTTERITEVSSDINFDTGLSVYNNRRTQVELNVSDPDLSIISTYTGTQSSVGVITHNLTYTLDSTDTTTETTVDSSSNLEVQSTFVGHKDLDGVIVQHFLYGKETSLVTNTNINCSNQNLEVQSTFVGHKDTTGTLVYNFVYESYTSSSETRYGWFLNDLDLVNLANYDLEVTGNPQVGDTITLTYVTTEQTDYQGWIFVENNEHATLANYDLEIVSGTPQLNDYITVTYVTTTESTYHWLNEKSQEVTLANYDLQIVSGTPKENDTIDLAYVTTLGQITVSVDIQNQTPSTSTNTSIATTKFVRNLQTYQPITTFNNGAIVLQDDVSVYAASSSISTATTFTFSTSNLNYLSSSVFYTFEVKFDMTTVSTLTFPSNITWQNNEIPSFDSTGTYLLVFRTLDGGLNWIGNLQGYWD